MKKLNYALTNEDCIAISSAIAVLPEYPFFNQNSEFAQLTPLITSVLKKLSTHKPIKNPRECYLIAVAIDSAIGAINGSLSISTEGLNSIREHFFTYNKLFPMFKDLLVE